MNADDSTKVETVVDGESDGKMVDREGNSKQTKQGVKNEAVAELFVCSLYQDRSDRMSRAGAAVADPRARV